MLDTSFPAGSLVLVRARERTPTAPAPRNPGHGVSHELPRRHCTRRHPGCDEELREPVSLWGQDSGRCACFPWCGRCGLCCVSFLGDDHGTPTDAQPAGGAAGFQGPPSSRAFCSRKPTVRVLWLEGEGRGAPGPTQLSHSTPEDLQPEWAAAGTCCRCGSVGTATRAWRAFLEAESSARAAPPATVPTAVRPQGRCVEGSQRLQPARQGQGQAAATLWREARSPGEETRSGRLEPVLSGVRLPGDVGAPRSQDKEVPV